MTQPFEFNDGAGGWKGKARGGFVLVVDNFGEEHFGAGGERACGHLLGVAHQFVEVDFRRCDECADATAALDEAFAFQESKGVARSHETDMVGLGEVTLRRDGVAGLELAGIDALANDALNALIRGQTAGHTGGEALSHSKSFFAGGHRLYLLQRTIFYFGNTSSPEMWAALVEVVPRPAALRVWLW